MLNGLQFRRWLLAVLLFGIVGTETELLLLGHWEDWKQWIPLTLLGIAIPVVAWAIAAPGQRAAKVLRVVMVLFVVSGVIGVWLHYRGNAEFEIEMTPDASGWSLFKDAVTGATPALAPGTMVWFGLLGLLAGWKTQESSQRRV